MSEARPCSACDVDVLDMPSTEVTIVFKEKAHRVLYSARSLKISEVVSEEPNSVKIDSGFSSPLKSKSTLPMYLVFWSAKRVSGMPFERPESSVMPLNTSPSNWFKTMMSLSSESRILCRVLKKVASSILFLA